MEKSNMINQQLNDLDIFKEIFKISKLINKYLNTICKKFNITQVQFDVIYLLYTSGDKCVKMSYIGDELGMARSGVTLLIDKMVYDGFVIRRPDLNDRRKINVILTEKGKEVMNEVFPSNGIFNTPSFNFIEEEKEFLFKIISKLKKLDGKIC